MNPEPDFLTIQIGFLLSAFGLLAAFVAFCAYHAGKRMESRSRRFEVERAFELGVLRGRQEERFDESRERILATMGRMRVREGKQH